MDAPEEGRRALAQGVGGGRCRATWGPGFQLSRGPGWSPNATSEKHSGFVKRKSEGGRRLLCSQLSLFSELLGPTTEAGPLEDLWALPELQQG